MSGDFFCQSQSRKGAAKLFRGNKVHIRGNAIIKSGDQVDFGILCIRLLVCDTYFRD